jgi:hypothetical protein
MIKFFRKIRQRLLTENKFNKYLLYAIGEVILVVIGIMIALQVNNWNQDRISNSFENSYLLRLKSEITSDTTLFKSQIVINQEKNNKIQRFTNLLNSENSISLELVDATEKYFENAWYIPLFNPTMATFEDLSSSGKLEVISNVSLRIKIIDLYTAYILWKEGLASNNNWGLDMDVHLNKSTDGMKWDKRTVSLFTTHELEEEARILRLNKDYYIRNAAVHYWINDYFIEVLESIIQQEIEVLNEIEKELQIYN